MSPVCKGLLGAGLYASPMLRLSNEVSSFEPSVAWNLMSKSWGAVLTVADNDPAESVAELADLEILTELDVGFPAGYRSK